MEHDVFISYSSLDKEAANALCHTLEDCKIRCWIAPRDIPAGTQYGDLIDEAIKKSKVVVILFSETAAISPWVNGEMNIAFEEQKVIIPFRLDNTPLKGQNRIILNQKHWIDAFPDYKAKFNDLTNAVSNALGSERHNDIVEEITKPKSYNKKYLLIGFVSVLSVILVFFLFPYISNTFHSFKYDRIGIHINMKGLTSEQESALSSILDNMVLVEGGDFLMGNNTNLDYLTKQDSLTNNSHNVKLDNFYICKYEVRQSEWDAFMNLDGKCIELGDNKAMDMLSWEDANAFTIMLSEITGLQFSLPTEAQWEYAAKGGKKSLNYLFAGYSEDGESVNRVAWTSFDGFSSAQNVGLKQANELELYDMTGNVSEWCLDYYAPYESDDAINPQGPKHGMDRIYRGGDFRTPNLWDLKTTTRFYSAPFVNRKGTGMRLVINI